MSEWELICKWIRDRGIPEDAKISLAHPPDGRIWIDVISESFGYDSCTDATAGPDCDFDPSFDQYMLISVDQYYNSKTALEEALEHLESVDN